MSLVNLLRRLARQFASLWSANFQEDLIYGDVDGRLRMMSDEEFIEYLRLHTKSHHWDA